MKYYKILDNNYLEQYKNMNIFTHIGLAFQNIFTPQVIMRFIRVLIGGTFSGMATILGLGYGVTDYKSLQVWIVALAIGGIFGGISAVVMAGDKAFRMVDTSPVIDTTTNTIR